MEEPKIGELKKIYKPGMENLFAGVALGLLGIGGGGCLVYFVALGQVIETGGVMPMYAEKGPCWFTVLIVGGIGLALIVGGAFLIRWMRSLSSLRVRLGQHGFSVTQESGVRDFFWNDIRTVKETRLYERPPILKGVAKFALPKLMSKSYTITRRDNEQFNFCGTTIKGHLKLADAIQAEAAIRNIPWEIEEVQG